MSLHPIRRLPDMPHEPALSQRGLTTLHHLMGDLVATGQMPGLITLVASADEVHVDVVGTTSFADPAPLTRDAIFRIASFDEADHRGRRDVADR